jgi:hypothetical protein
MSCYFNCDIRLSLLLPKPSNPPGITKVYIEDNRYCFIEYARVSTYKHLVKFSLSPGSSSTDKKQKPPPMPKEDLVASLGQRKGEHEQSSKYEDATEQEVEPEISWAEWMEERGRLVFAFVLCTLLLVFVLPALFLTAAPTIASDTSSSPSPSSLSSSLQQGEGHSIDAGSGLLPASDGVATNKEVAPVGATTRILSEATIDANKKDE